MDATFFALVGLIIFIGIIVYLKVPGMVTKALDERAGAISDQLAEAKSLREEAQKLLVGYQNRRVEAEKEAEDIIAAARRDADNIAEEARAKTADYVKRREAMAAQKIGQAETDAINDVKSKAVEIAIAASTSLLSDRMDAKAAGDMFKSSLIEIKSKLN